MKKRMALLNCTIINGDMNREIEKDMVILVNNQGIIEKIENRHNIIIPKEYEQIDLKHQFVMPGLINAHAHLFSDGSPTGLSFSEEVLNFGIKLLDTKLGKKLIYNRIKKNALVSFQSGITTLRSVGEFFYQDVKLRDDILNEKLIGPDLLVSGFFISATGGHGAPYLALETDGPWEGVKNVRKNVRQGVDLIKICVTGGVTDAKTIGEAGRIQLTEEEVYAICKEAHKIGMMVAAHVESTEGVRIALKGGVDTIEHGATMDEEIISLYKQNPNALRGYTSLIPTFQAAYPYTLLDRNITNINNVLFENAKIVYTDMMISFQQAIDNDISVGVGNDAAMAYVSHYDLWRELDHMIRFGGINEKKAIHLVTKSNSEILGISKKVGTIDVGKKANLLVLPNNPIQNIKNLSKISLVIKNGILFEDLNIKKNEKLDNTLDLI
ncbi:metal-dependent hydrolase family protein [Bacillus thuringiensis]|uniref:metal-dependent hydrolase family protein n=1 Tax=Bacillus thuringiensis TaxID=1428 RepID=UPI001588220C|nr:amidohydrolase family protein [Bacillus thuringiensis]MCT6946982.1 amidohydrolase family protein [Bacillus thuringiensis]MEE2015670.1 amidohydrolase family protein [Bacillus thuringiensis]NUW47190.1 amidohydrolase family protein [Bacillus thuringiensis]HDR6820379.1 amidohydrolase family protein [Bacillus thuringiensis]